MKLGIDEYAGLDSPLHRWDARYKLVGLLILVFAFSFVRDLRVLLAIALITAAIYIISGLPARFILRWLRFPSLIILVIVLTLPFLSGETVIASIGPLAVRQEGLLAALLIAVRFACIVTVGITLFATTSLLNSIKAMRALGLPLIMADMALLAFRYLNELGQDLSRMLTSMKLRGFRQRTLSPGGLKTFAWLSGSLLVRSYERSEWVYKAMILRGYGQSSSRPQGEFQAHPVDGFILGAVVIIAAALVTADILLGHNIAAILQ
jgi:cobalt/nickel transport system permease protein